MSAGTRNTAFLFVSLTLISTLIGGCTKVATPTHDPEMAAACRDFEYEVVEVGDLGFTPEEILLYLYDSGFTPEELDRLIDRCIDILKGVIYNT